MSPSFSAGPVRPPYMQKNISHRNYRLRDITDPGGATQSRSFWDFKANNGGRFKDSDGQFRDIQNWTGVRPQELIYSWGR